MKCRGSRLSPWLSFRFSRSRPSSLRFCLLGMLLALAGMPPLTAQEQSASMSEVAQLKQILLTQQTLVSNLQRSLTERTQTISSLEASLAEQTRLLQTSEARIEDLQRRLDSSAQASASLQKALDETKALYQTLLQAHNALSKSLATYKGEAEAQVLGLRKERDAEAARADRWKWAAIGAAVAAAVAAVIAITK